MDIKHNLYVVKRKTEKGRYSYLNEENILGGENCRIRQHKTGFVLHACVFEDKELAQFQADRVGGEVVNIRNL